MATTPAGQSDRKRAAKAGRSNSLSYRRLDEDPGVPIEELIDVSEFSWPGESGPAAQAAAPDEVGRVAQASQVSEEAIGEYQAAPCDTSKAETEDRDR